MTFSILTPVYNVATYLRECLDAVMGQTYKDFELILVDDGSTDDSGRICDEYAERYSDHIRVIHKANQGLISARRVGIAAATGDFCVFLDSDDSVEPDWLETAARYLQKDDQIDVLLYSFRYLRDGVLAERFASVAEDGHAWVGDEKRELYDMLLTSNKITSIWTKAIRTSVLQSDPTDYTVYYGKNMAEDLLQDLYPLTAADKVVYADVPLYRYRINVASVSRSFRPATIPSKNTLHVYEKILEYLPTWGMDNEASLERLNGRWFNDVMYTLCCYYEGAATGQDRQDVLAFDWNTFLPPTVVQGKCPCGNLVYQKLYGWWREKRYGCIKRFFNRRKWNRIWKNWKKRIKGK